MSKTLKFKFKGTEFSKLAKPSDFHKAVEVVKSKAKMILPDECYLKIGNDIVLDAETFKAVLEKQKEKRVEVIVEAGKPPSNGIDENGEQIVIFFNGNRHGMALDTSGKFDRNAFENAFLSFLNNNLGIKKDDLFNNVKVYHIESENKMNDTSDAVDDLEIIGDHAEQLFDDDSILAAYFVLKSDNILVSVDLCEADSDFKEATLSIPKADVNDIEALLSHYDALHETIGKSLKNEKWDEQFSLFSTENETLIEKLEDFGKCFKNINDSKVVSFKLKVGAAAPSKKLFVIEHNGHSISWEASGNEDEYFASLKALVESSFKVELDDKPITYNPYTGVNSINISNTIDDNELTQDNINEFWNLLLNDKRAKSMNFIVGVPKKRALLLSKIGHQRNGQNISVYYGESSDDEEENYRRLIGKVDLVLGNENKEQEDEIDYSELPYRVFKIERDTLKTMLSNEQNLLNNSKIYSTLKNKYDLDCEIEDEGEFTECYDSDDTTKGKDCVLLVQYKHSLLFDFNGKLYEWVPSGFKMKEEISWEKEYGLMLNDVLKYYEIDESNGTIVFKNEENEKMSDSDAFEVAWGEMMEDDDKLYHKITMSFAPSNFKVTVDKHSFKFPCQYEPGDALASFAKEIGAVIGNAEWQQTHNLVNKKDSNVISEESQLTNMLDQYLNDGVYDIAFTLKEKDIMFEIRVSLTDGGCDEDAVLVLKKDDLLKENNFGTIENKIGQLLGNKEWSEEYFVETENNECVTNSKQFVQQMGSFVESGKPGDRVQVALFLRRKETVFSIVVNASEAKMEEAIKMSLKESELEDKNTFDLMRNTIGKALNKPEWTNDYFLNSETSEALIDQNHFMSFIQKFLDNREDTSTRISLSLVAVLPPEAKMKRDGKKEVADVGFENKKLLDSKKEMVENDVEALLDVLIDNIGARRKLAALLIEMLDDASDEMRKALRLTKDVENVMRERFDQLLKGLENEGYGQSTYVYERTKAAENEALRSQEWIKSFGSLKTVMTNIRPFNIKKMLELYDLTDAASEKLKGQDIALLLGHTGAGKSTTIHYLANSTLVQDANTQHIYPVKFHVPEAKEIGVEWTVAESVTRYVNTVPVKLAEAGIKQMGRGAKNLIQLCDTPGFGDSSGPEVDVANGLGIVKAAQKSKNAKVLLVMGFDDLGRRMNGAKQLAATLGNIFPTFGESLGCIHVIMTKVPPSHVNTIKKTFEKATNELSASGDAEMNNENVVTLFQHIQDDESQVMPLNPLKTDRKQFLKDIFQGGQWITKPYKAFQSFVSSSSKDKVNQQVLKHKEKITKTLNKGNDDISSKINYRLVGDKLNDLQRLSQLLPDLQSIEDNLKDCLKTVINSWNSRMDQAITMVERSVKEKGNIEDFVKDLKLFKSIKMNMDENDKTFREKHLKSSNNSEKETKFWKDIPNAKDSGSLMLSLNEQFEIILNNCNLDEATSEYFSKAKIFVHEFPTKFNALFNDRLDKIGNTVETLEKDTEQSIENNELAQVFEKLTILSKATHLTQALGQRYDLLKTSMRLESMLLNHLNEELNRLTGIFENDLRMIQFGTKSDSLKVITSIVTMVNEAQTIFSGYQSKTSNLGSQIVDIYKQLLKQTCDYCGRLSESIRNILVGKDDDLGKGLSSHQSATDRIRPYMIKLAKVRAINEDLRSKTAEIYFQTIEQIVGYLRNMQKEFQDIIDGFENDNKEDRENNDSSKKKSKIDYKRLAECATVVKNCQWVFGLRNGKTIEEALRMENENGQNSTNEVIRRLESKMNDYLQILIDEADAVTIQLQKSENLDVVANMISQLKNIRDLRKVMPSVGTLVDEAAKTLQSKVQKVLTKIEKEFTLITIDKMIQDCEKNRALVSKMLELSQKNISLKREDEMQGEMKEDRKEMENEDNEGNVMIQTRGQENKGQKESRERKEENKEGKENEEEMLKITMQLENYGYTHSKLERMKQDANLIKENMEMIESELNELKKKQKGSNQDGKDTYSFDRVSAFRASQAINFIGKCGNIKWFRVGRGSYALTDVISELRDNYRKFMQKYGETRINEMKNALNYLKELHNEKEDDGRQLIEAGFVLSEGLLELVRMGKRYENVMSNLTETGENILDENRWPHLMQATLTHLQNEFLKLDQASDDGLAWYINNAHELSRCDWYFQDELKLDESERFNKLYVEYQKRIAKRAGLEKFEEALSNGHCDFARAGEELKNLAKLAGAGTGVSARAQNTLEKAKERLGRAMFDLNENTRIKVVQLGSDMSLKDLAGLKSSFEKIGEAQTNCQEYLTQKWKPRVQESSESTKGSLLRWINNFLGSIFNLIETKQFSEAEKKIEVANNMATMLHDLLKDDETLKRVKNLEAEVTKKIEGIENKYLKLNSEFAKVGCTHNPYTSEPPKDIYTSLSVDSIKDKRIRYSQFWTKIWKDFEEKFHCKLESAMKNPRERKNSLHLAKISLESWPDKEKKILVYDLEKTMKELEKRMEDLKQQLNDLLNGNDFNKLRELYEEMEQQREYDIMYLISEELSKRLTIHSETIEKKLEQASDVFEVLCKMNEIHEQFSKKVKHRQLIGIYEKSIELVETKVEKNVNEIERKMKALHKDHLPLLCDDLDFVSTLSRKNKEANILTSVFDAHCSKLYAFLKNYFDDLDDSYQSGLTELDMEKLDNVLNTMQKYSTDNESYLRQIQKLEDVKINNVRFFKTMVLELTGNFKKMQESVCNEGLMKEKFESSNEREEYFIELKKKLIGLRRSEIISGYLGNGKEASQYLNRCVNELTQEGTRLQNQIINEINDDKLTKEKTLTKIHKQLDTLRMAEVVQLEPSQLRNHLAACLVESKRAVANCIKKISQDAITLTEKEGDVREMKLEIPLSQLYCAANYLLHFKDDIEKEISSILSSFQKTKMTLINTLASLLEQENHWGAGLVSEHGVFRGAAIMKFSKLTKDNGIDFVLEHIRGTSSNNMDEIEIEKEDLSRTFKEFDEKYKELINMYLNMKKELHPADQLTSETKTLAEKIKHEQGMKWNTQVKEKAVELMAFIFALWTIQNSEYYFQAGGGSDHDSFLMQPRAAQVISIIRLLSIDVTGKDKTMDRNLVEIGTGEGKSLTLGVTSALLALLGYDVSCACYSEYLSRRDYSAFEELFNALGVAQYIHYGTFNQLCERIINDGGNVRQLTEELILPPTNEVVANESEKKDDEKENESKSESLENARPKILIIDEVDVFFNKEFYGNVYVPGATLRHKTITKLTDWIWKTYLDLSEKRMTVESTTNQNEKNWLQRGINYVFGNDDTKGDGNEIDDSDGKTKSKKDKKDKKGKKGENKKENEKQGNRMNDKMEDEFSVTVGMIKKSNEYSKCKDVFGKWTPLLDEAIKDMVADLKTFASTDYVVIDGKIGYKDGDSISTSQMYGYRTLWTYYYEHSSNKVTQQTLESIVGIYLKCGTFSYAEIPSKFDSILGVTGTLETLLEPERRIMKETYGIDKYTYMPSLFGKTKFSFDEKEDIILADTMQFHEILKEEIRKKLKQFGQGRERCVFVFFENEKKLMDFYNYTGFIAAFKPRTLILTEKSTKDEKITNVRKAPTSNRILLSTKVFGRGTDFQVRDGIVEHNGGPHVIQTFVSDQVSEEKQIKGRTARQGGEGSYSMVLLKSDLEKYGISEDDIKSAIENKNLYQLINEKRHDFFAQEYKENSDFVKQVSEAHNDSEIFLKALKEKDTKTAINKLKSYNMGAGSGKVKVAILVDATASMGKLLQKAKNTVGIMYSRISDILTDKNVDSKCFQLQFIAYRNYNAPSDELLRYSGWCNNSVSLRQFLDDIEASYGWGNEAAEAGLSYVEDMIKKHNNEINEIIIIGDAGFNTKEHIVKKMKQKGKTYWARAGFDSTNTAFDYLAFFKQLEIKINCFYLHERAKGDFERVAKETDGESCFLDVNDEKNSSEILTRLISESVLNAAGGDAFVKAYREKYGDAGVQVANK